MKITFRFNEQTRNTPLISLGLVLFLSFFFCIPVSAQQVIGTFPTMDGGFEGQATGDLGVQNIATNTQTTAWTSSSSDAGLTRTISTTSPRTGNKYVTWGSTSTGGKRLQSPTAGNAAVLNATVYTVQFYYRTPGSTAFATGQVANSTDGTVTTSISTWTGVTMAATNGAWAKVTGSVTSTTSAASPRYGIGLFRTSGNSGTNADIDDFVMYEGAADNSAPDPVTGLTITSGSSQAVSWTAPATGVDGGGYMVVRGTTNPTTTPNANGIYAVNNTIASGEQVVYLGTATSFSDPTSTLYYYRVYTVDKAFNYSTGVSAQGTATVTYAPEPTTQASAINFTNVSATSMTINWTSGNGEKRIVAMRSTTGSTEVVPTDGTSYTANSTLGSGSTLGTSEFVVYNGTGSSVTVSGLSTSTTYSVRVYEFNETGGEVNYLTSGSAVTQLTPNYKYYSTGSVDAATLASWNTARDGSGSVPTAFTSGEFYIQNGHSMTTSAVWNVGGANAKLIIETGGSLEATQVITIASGATFQMASGSMFVQNVAMDMSTTIMNGTEVFDANSTYEIKVAPTVTGKPVSPGWGNVKLNVATGSTTFNWATGIFSQVQGNFTVDATGVNAYHAFTGGANTTTSIGGNLVVNGGKFAISSGNGTNPTSVSGNIIVNGGVLDICALAGGTSEIILTANGGITVSNGASLKSSSALSKLVINGSGTHTLQNAGTCSVPKMDINSGAVLEVNATSTLTVSSALTNNGTLTLLSNGSGTATIYTAGTVSTGTYNVNQALTSYRSWYMSSPVASAQPTGMNRIKYYNEADNTWPTLFDASTTPYGANSFTSGKGYLVVPDNDDTNIQFSGNLNSGNISVDVTKSTTTNPTKAGFNLIGNPYPSYLDWTAVYTANSAKLASSTLWYRTKSGSYTFWTVNGESGMGSPETATKNIPPMQAFWVKVNATDVLSLTNTMRVSPPSDNKLLKVKQDNNIAYLRLQVSNGENTDETVLYFDDRASNELDAYDSPKMNNNNLSVSEIYTTLNNEQMVINGMKNIPVDVEIPIGFLSGNATQFEIKANAVSNINDLRVILTDKTTNVETDLTDGISNYKFNSNASGNNRFSIVFRSTGTTTKLNENPKSAGNLSCSYSNGELIFNGNGSDMTGMQIMLYNSTGQLVSVSTYNNNHLQLNRKLENGIYIVKIGHLSAKIII